MQEEYFGYGKLKCLEGIIQRYDPTNIFIVTGERSFHSSGAEDIIIPFIEDLNYFRFTSSKNPNIELIGKGINAFKKFDPDLVIAIGGGSSLDLAKSINVLSFQPTEHELYIKGKKLLNPGLSLIAIPTTAGSGSECTSFATIYIDKKKYSLSNEEFMLPTISIVDPGLTISLSKYQTACSGFDAICQGIEAYWSVNSIDISMRWAFEAIELGFENIVNAVNKSDKTSRLNMARAAHLAGKAINISKTTACHSISYPITSFYDIPHGQAVAVTMPSFIEFNSHVCDMDCNDRRGAGNVRKKLEKMISLMECENAREAKQWFMNLMENSGLKIKLSDLGIDENGVCKIIEHGFTPDRMNNNPRKVSVNHLEEILRGIM